MRLTTLKLAGLCALLLGPGWVAPGQAPKAKLQVLIVTGQNTASHDWHGTTQVLRKLLEESGRFEVRVTEESARRGAGYAGTVRRRGAELLRRAQAGAALGRAHRERARQLRTQRQRTGGVPLRDGGVRRLDGVREDVRGELASEQRAPLGAARLHGDDQGSGASDHTRDEGNVSAGERRAVREPEVAARGRVPRA